MGGAVVAAITVITWPEVHLGQLAQKTCEVSLRKLQQPKCVPDRSPLTAVKNISFMSIDLLVSLI